MSNFVLSKAMGDIPDDLLQEAMDVRKRSSVGWMIFRAAACLAVVIGLIAASWGLRPSTDDIVAAPGILTVTVYAENQSFMELSPNTVLPYDYCWTDVNWAPGLPITLCVDKENYVSDNITFRVTVDGGGFYIGKEGDASIYPGISHRCLPEFEISNNTTIFWSQYYDANGNDSLSKNKSAYADILIYDGVKIVGYAVIRFDCANQYLRSFTVAMVASGAFSPDDKDITEQYVSKIIEESHKN